MVTWLAEARCMATTSHGGYLRHFGEIEGGDAVLTIDGMGQRDSGIGWETEMNDGGQPSSLGGHAGRVWWVTAALSVPFIGRRVGGKGVWRGCDRQ
jgi:hypothetical protein